MANANQTSTTRGSALSSMRNGVSAGLRSAAKRPRCHIVKIVGIQDLTPRPSGTLEGMAPDVPLQFIGSRTPKPA